jgi:lysophospholipase L1-like esterase
MRSRVAVALAAMAIAGLAGRAEAFWLPPDFAGNNPAVVSAVGDSITLGVLGRGEGTANPAYPARLQALLVAQHQGLTVMNRGVGGETTDEGLTRLASVLATDRPGFVLIMEGTNDATFGRDPAGIVANLRAMVRLAKANSSIPILGAIIPNFREIADEPREIIAAVNAVLPAVAAQEDVRFVNTFSPLNNGGLFGDDRLHPTQAGYNVLAAAWQPRLHDALQDSFALLGGVTVAGAHFDGPAAARQIVGGFGPGRTSGVRTFRPENQVFGPMLLAYPGFLGGVRVAACDFDGDGVDEIVTGPGPGGGPHVRVMQLDSSGNPIGDLASFFAYPPAFTGGVFVACGDIDGDMVPEIVVGAGRGGGPHVRAFRYDPGQPGGVADAGVTFFAYSPAFAGGVEVAVGNVDDDPQGRSQIITGAGRGGGPHVRVFAHSSGVPGGVVETGVSFFAYSPGFTGGVHVAAGDLNGDGRAELITGAGPGGGPHVRILRRGAGGVVTPVAEFFAYVPEFRGGVSVATAGAQVLTGAGPGGGPHVRGFTAQGTPTDTSFFAY